MLIAAEEVTLRDRQFVTLKHPTLEGMRHWMWLVKKGGLEALHRRPFETPDHFREQVRQALLDSGVAYRLMTIWLSPKGEPWTAEAAGLVASDLPVTTAALLSQPETEEESAVQLRLFGLVLDCLVSELEGGD